MYAKVYKSMWEGSLAGTAETWAVFVFLLANSDRAGFVDMHPRVIAGLTGFGEERVRKALVELGAPDGDSRTQAEGGARLELIDSHRDWGWRIVNYEKYRTMADADTRREQNREAQKKTRQHKQVQNADMSAGVSNGQHPSAQVDVEAEVEAEKEEPKDLSPDGDMTVRDLQTEKPKRKKTPTTNKGLDAEWMQAFDEIWWTDYGTLDRKCSRAAAREVWAKIPHPDGQSDFDVLWDEWESAKATWREEKREPRFIPHAEVWLRDYMKNLALEA